MDHTSSFLHPTLLRPRPTFGLASSSSSSEDDFRKMLKSLERCYALSSDIDPTPQSGENFVDDEAKEEVVDLDVLERSFVLTQEDGPTGNLKALKEEAEAEVDLKALERSFSKKQSSATTLDPSITTSPTTSLQPLTSRIVSSISQSASPIKIVNIFTPLTSLLTSQSKLNSGKDVNKIYDHNVLNDIAFEVADLLGCEFCYSSECRNESVKVLKTINEFDDDAGGDYDPGGEDKIVVVNARSLSDTVWIRDLVKSGCGVVLLNPAMEVMRSEEVFVLEPFEIVDLGKFLIIGGDCGVDVFWKEGGEDYEYIGRKDGGDGWGIEDVMEIVRRYLDIR
ncbi:hypothetical protein TL16_g05748 [Triparma laevis f. inornata]|uniref:Uncharacterized protein n=1 Tax=Triparma laevis f. inornata TaxID=1714386 RepID=A0A9W7AP09_9STRA|nr:hypothetical protein TL16_g05748 [Triparma laevis f. inornata]